MQSHVEFGADGYVEVVLIAAGGGGRTIVPCRGAGWGAGADGDVTASAVPDGIDPIAQVQVLVASDPLVLPELHLQIDALVACVVELALELGSQRAITRAKLGHVP